MLRTLLQMCGQLPLRYIYIYIIERDRQTDRQTNRQIETDRDTGRELTIQQNHVFTQSTF